jgi:hypothetical protein
MLSREPLESPTRRGRQHIHQFVYVRSRYSRGSSIVCTLLHGENRHTGNTRRNSCVNVIPFYQVTCAVQYLLVREDHDRALSI